MSARAGAISRRTRRFLPVSASFLVAWQAGVLVGIGRRTAVSLALFGFVFHAVFGKAYSLVPSYFDRELAFPRAPAVHLPLTATGALCLAAAPLPVPPVVGTLGAACWSAGVGVFLVTLGWTVRGNLAGRETGTGASDAHRRPIDRAANAFVPVAGTYLLVGSYGVLARYTPLPLLLDGYGPRTSHLLAAGAAALLVFAIGFRLLPRLFVATPPKPLVALCLPTGAIGPALLASGLGGRWWFRLGAALEAIAVLGFALAVAVLFSRSDRRRVGFYGVLVGAASGVCGVLLGLAVAFGVVVDPALFVAHFRSNLLGFLGATIVGAVYGFYPPSVGTFPGATDRTALASIVCLGGGLSLQVLGLGAGLPLVTTAGEATTLLGASVYAALLGGVLYERGRR